MLYFQPRMGFSSISLPVEAVRRFFGIQDEGILKQASMIRFLAKERLQSISLRFSRKEFLSLLMKKLSVDDCKKINADVSEQDILEIDPVECELFPDIFD